MKGTAIIGLILILLSGGGNLLSQNKRVYKVDVVNVSTDVETSLYVLAKDGIEAAQNVSLNGWKVLNVEPFGKYAVSTSDNKYSVEIPRLEYVLTVYFPPCKYTTLIDNETIKKIKSLNEDSQYIIYGHTDSLPVKPTENYKNNYELSLLRARFLKNFIYSITNVPADNIKIVGLGAMYPKVDNSIQGEPENRRAEVYERH
ncbi:MAG: OmpA family protein [Deferribacterota bacterium]|nr:OmpA family protein [Deferribacterota bacterium]